MKASKSNVLEALESLLLSTSPAGIWFLLHSQHNQHLWRCLPRPVVSLVIIQLAFVEQLVLCTCRHHRFKGPTAVRKAISVCFWFIFFSVLASLKL